jgi:hypothetical protein
VIALYLARARGGDPGRLWRGLEMPHVLEL